MEATDKNFAAIQAIVASKQSEIAKHTGVTLGRAWHQAVDFVGPTLTPPMSGDQLAAWTGSKLGDINRKRSHKSAKMQQSQLPEMPKCEPIQAPISDMIASVKKVDDAVWMGQRYAAHGTIRQQVEKSVSGMAVNETRAITCTSDENARKFQRNLSFLKDVLKWEYQSMIEKSAGLVVYVKRTK